MVRIADITPGSIAADLELEIGSRIVRINGAPVRDTVDLRFLEVDGSLELELTTESGERILFDIDKDAGDPLGVVPAADPVRQCANKCVFCFIDGNPEGARTSLHLKDDDFRLSFTYGTYVTLTNLGPRGLQRLIDQRLSPLYVSVHATEPAVRERLLGVPRGGTIVDDLRGLLAGGIEVHTQIVLCPGWNDGAHLTRTIDDLWALGPGVLSLSVVPVGLTRYNLNRPVRLLTTAEAARALDRIDEARTRALSERDGGWIYAADEMFYIAGRDLPSATYYDDWPLTENGVGAVRRLLDDFDADIDDAHEDGPDEPRGRAGERVAFVTGTRMAPVLEPLITRLNTRTRAAAAVVAVDNHYFGETVTTAGLLAGADIIRALATVDCEAVVLPAESLNDDERFIDDLPLSELVRRLAPRRVVAAHDLIDGFRRSAA
jgi:putative radical SAM enzyme (TIGR03279 family)